MVKSFAERVNQGESLASWLNWLTDPLLCAGLWSLGTYHPAEKGYTGPFQRPSERTTKLCCAQHGPLTCDPEKCCSLRSSYGMYNLERRLRYSHLLTRHCPRNLLPEPIYPKHEYRGQIWIHPVTSSMTSSLWKLFPHNLGRSFYIWGQHEAVFNISNFSKWSPFWALDKPSFTGSDTGR